MKLLRRNRPDPSLELQSELQALRLELGERERTIRQLLNDRARTDGSADGDRLRAAIATPLVQLATQSQIHGVDADSVLAVARSLVRAVEDEGFELIGRVGAVAPYDAARHEPLGEVAPAAGDAVVVRFVGLAYGGDVLRAAAVEPAP